jgi:hypothetical protein
MKLSELQLRMLQLYDVVDATKISPRILILLFPCANITRSSLWTLLDAGYLEFDEQRYIVRTDKEIEA